MQKQLDTKEFGPNAESCQKQAVAVIRDFADNGEVRWDHFDETGKEIK